MSLFQLVLSFEKRGHLDLKITGHAIDRPANVQRGEAPDCVNVTHQAHSVFKPNAVAARHVKGTNIAGLIGNKCLAASQYLTMVWRFLGLCLRSFGFLLKSFLFDFWWWVSLCNPTPRNEALCSWKGRWSCQAFVVCKGQLCLGAEGFLPSRVSEDTPWNLNNVFFGCSLANRKQSKVLEHCFKDGRVQVD